MFGLLLVAAFAFWAVMQRETVAEIAEYLDLDSLHYLSLEGLVQATGMTSDDFCLACFNGNYPIEPDRSFHKNILG